MNKKKTLMIVLGIFALVIVTTAASFAFFTYSRTGNTKATIISGDIEFSYIEGDSAELTNAFPVSDEIGAIDETGEYTFQVKLNSSGTTSANYNVYLVDNNTGTNHFTNEQIKFALIKNDVFVANTSATEGVKLSSIDGFNEGTSKGEGIVLEDQEISSGETDEYKLRIWISDDVSYTNEYLSDGTMEGKYNSFTYSLKVKVTSGIETNTTYKEALLNGADPVLKSSNKVAKMASTNKDELIPVIIDDKGTVTKADINKKWYSYEEKQWANAVILKDNSITYNNGDVIPESNIESYFVWIPKYSYQLWDLGNYSDVTTTVTNKAKEIEIRFGTTNTDDSVAGECTTPGVAGQSGKCVVGDYMTHPAFLAFNTTGLWVGKFETGFSATTAPTETTGLSPDTSKIIIKPNVYSWRNNTIGNFFKLGYDYLRDEESHMMKNTEWGATAYLQHSSYGSSTSVRINNNSNYITGYASTEEPTKGYNADTSVTGNRVESTSLGVDGTYTVNYLNTASTVASTTGNYSGIYDMSGGVWEYVMGYTTGSTIGVGGSSGITSLYSDFFTNSNWNKYYDTYSSTAKTDYSNRILGDATGEMGPFFSENDPDGGVRYKNSWYRDYAHFAFSDNPWFNRGGALYDGSASGVFAFSNQLGEAVSRYGFRIVLAPTK